MANPLFNQLGNSMGGNNPMNMIGQFNQFRQNFKGDAKQEVQRLLNSGQMSQQQFNELQAKASQFQKMLGIK